MDAAPKKDIRVIGFQMTICPDTGMGFQVTSDIPRDATAAEIAKEMSTIREAGFIEMAATNRRKLERAKIIKDTLLEKLAAAKQKGDPVKGGQITAAKEAAFTSVLEMEAECDADDKMIALAAAA